MSRPTWTPEQDAELIRLRHEGFSYSEIGRAFGVTRYAAIGRAYRLQRNGVEFPATAAKLRWTSEMDERLKQLRLDGLSFGQIAMAMKISRCAAIGRAYRLIRKGVNVANNRHHRKVGITTKIILEFMNAEIGASIYFPHDARSARVRSIQLGGPGWVTTRRIGNGRRFWKIAEPCSKNAGKEAAQ